MELWNYGIRDFGGCGGCMEFFVAFCEALWNFPRQDHEFKEFRGFPGMELGIFRVAKSSGEGRGGTKTGHSLTTISP